MGAGQQGRARRPSSRPRSAQWADEILRAVADRAEGAQAVVQHRHRAVRLGGADGVLDSDDVRRDTRGAGGHHRVQREARARLRRLPRQLSRLVGWREIIGEELGTMTRIFASHSAGRQADSHHRRRHRAGPRGRRPAGRARRTGAPVGPTRSGAGRGRRGDLGRARGQRPITSRSTSATPTRSTAAVAEIWDRHGPLTGLLNNAAANFIAPTVTLSPRAFEAITSTVMTGSFNTTLAVGKRWIAEGSARDRCCPI